MKCYMIDAVFSKRKIDGNGYLHVECNISKEGVFPYYGVEIDTDGEIRLDPEKIYNVYRPAEELKKAAETFNGVPLLLDHHLDSAENPQKEYRVGSVSDVYFDENDGYLKGILHITDESAIKLINSNENKEISCAYSWNPVFEENDFKNNKYNIRMVNLEGNHVALVHRGRCGANCSVSDSADFLENIEENKKMEEFKKDVEENVAISDEVIEEKNEEVKEEIKEESPDVELFNKLREDHDFLLKVKEYIDSIEDEGEAKEEENLKEEEVLSDGCGETTTKASDSMFSDSARKYCQEMLIAANDTADIIGMNGKEIFTKYNKVSDIYKAALLKKGVNVNSYDSAAYKGMFDVMKQFDLKFELTPKSNDDEISENYFKNLNNLKY